MTVLSSLRSANFWGTNKRSTNIIPSGLVLHLDASNTNSYPGSGTTWNDLSTTIGNVNINNRNGDFSFTTDSATGQKCIFNSSDRIANASPGIAIPNNNGFNKVEGTVEMWLKPTNISYAPGWFSNSDGSSYTNAANWIWFGPYDDTLYCRQGNASTCCNDVALGSFSTNYFNLNTWQHIVVSWKVSTGSLIVYKNSNSIVSRTDLPTDIPNSNPSTTALLFSGHTRTDGMQYKGYCNSYRIYNRQLSVAEITQNFNAHRNRFGV